MIPFERTTCACSDCVDCCKQQPASLHPGDFERIAAFLGETLEAAKRFFWASPGALVGKLVNGQVHTFRIGTITPRLVDGRCVFLDAQDRCQIHTVAPFGCAYFDTHMGTEEGQRRGMWHLRAVATDDEYQRLRDSLPKATSHTPRFAL